MSALYLTERGGWKLAVVPLAMGALATEVVSWMANNTFRKQCPTLQKLTDELRKEYDKGDPQAKEHRCTTLSTRPVGFGKRTYQGKKEATGLGSCRGVASSHRRVVERASTGWSLTAGSESRGAVSSWVFSGP